MPEGEVAAGTDDARAAAQGTVALAGMQVAGRALALGFVLVATRTLSTSDFGRYAIASALLLGASTVADLGTTAAVTKLVSQRADRADDIVGAALLPSAVLGLLSFAGLCAFVLVGGYPAVTRIDVVLAGLGLPFDAVTTTLPGMSKPLTAVKSSAAPLRVTPTPIVSV
ncbi:MAG: hypothetical protein QOF60_248, partial [Actinomycetota bacterium]|nr:hypothetical protein [Actinomycetota bacterium]